MPATVPDTTLITNKYMWCTTFSKNVEVLLLLSARVIAESIHSNKRFNAYVLLAAIRVTIFCVLFL